MKKTRILLMLHLSIWISLFCTVRAFAYIDPSVVSGLAISIAGVVVACSTAAIFFFRKMKKRVSKTLGIDENAGKEVEADIEISEESENNETQNNQ